MSQYAPFIILLPLLGFLHNAFAGLLWKQNAKKMVKVVAPAAVLGAFVFSVLAVMEMQSSPDHRLFASIIPGISPSTPWIKVGGFQVNFELLIDPLSLLMAMIVTGVGGLIHIYATSYMDEDPEFPRFFTYFNLFITMMLILVLGGNFLLMFVGWEGVGTCSYLLISFWHRQSENAKAGNKAFIVNRVGDLGFALGMMLIWSVFGTLSYFTPEGHGVLQMAGAGAAHGGEHAIAGIVDLAGNIVPTATLTLICVLLFVGAMGKSAQIPLWVWLPDAMAGPTPVSALIHAATMVTAGVVMLTRCSWLFVGAPAAMQFVAYIGLATAFIGATIGLVQNDIKRVLAFSTVSQLGYMFLACGVGNFTAGMFHVTTHAFFKALLFLGSGAVIHSMLGEQDMRKMGGLKKWIPKTWFIMFVGTYAIAGFPLLSGFWSKDEILHSASTANNGMMLYVVGLATAFMTAFYMNRLMHKTFYVQPQFVDGELPHQHHSNFDDHHAHGHDDHGHGHDEHGHKADEAHEEEDAHGEAHGHGGSQIHESPFPMMFPLYVLAFLSVAFGAYAHFTGAFEHFLESVVPHVAHHAEGPISETAGYIISSIVGIAGLLLAYVSYRKPSVAATGQLIPAESKPKNPIYNLLLNKWYWDDLYNFIFIRVGGIFAQLLWRVVDQGIIDGLITKVVAVWGVGGLSQGLRRAQTGYVRNYALAMLFGVVTLVLGLMGSWFIASSR